MVWDLRAALLKKEEMETSRLIDFDFRQRARAYRQLALALELSFQTILDRMLTEDDDKLLPALATQSGHTLEEVQNLYARALLDARADLIREFGDPTPYRLG